MGGCPLDVRGTFDLNAYTRRTQDGPCFVCELVRGNLEYWHPLIYEDQEHIAFLDKYPTLVGRTIVAPKRHVEHVIGDLSQNEFQRLMSIVYRVGRAIQAACEPERMYLVSLGSQAGNSHLHWHLAPLPPGTPYHQQQYYALMAEHGVLMQSREEQEAWAARIREFLERPTS